MAVRTTVIGLSISLPVITTIFVSLRIYTRIRIKRMKLDIDDHLAVAALASFLPSVLFPCFQPDRPPLTLALEFAPKVFCYILSTCALIGKYSFA